MEENKNNIGDSGSAMRRRQENPSASASTTSLPQQHLHSSPSSHIQNQHPPPPPPPPPPKFNAAKFGIAASITAVSVLLLFVLNLSYIFGSTFQSTSRSHAFDIAFVDYDHGGAVPQSFLAAYGSLKHATFPTIVIENATRYPTTDSLVEAVRSQEYWGAVCIMSGASARLEAALGGQSTTPYNPSAAVSYIWDEIRYPAISSSIVQPGVLQLTSVAQAIWQKNPSTVSSLATAIVQNATGPTLEIFLNPFQAAEISPWPAPQMAKVFYNTVAMAMPIVQQNIFLISFNGMAAKLGLFNKFSSWTTSCILLGVSLCFTFLGGLTTTSYIWAFREGWNVGGSQFMKTWMLYWFVMHIYYLFLDAALALFHIAFYPVIIVTFIFLNITSTCFPLEYSPGFYRWGQALPAYNAFQVLLNIWSSSHAKLYQSLPILFAWWLVCMCLSIYGMQRRWQAANRTGATV